VKKVIIEDIDFHKNKLKARGVAPGYINLAPLGLTLKFLLALKGCIIKARGNAPGACDFKISSPEGAYY
jgi:hypothetical protein